MSIVYPERSSQLTPEHATARMKWRDDRDDIYVLNGGIEKRMSTLSQQYRAVSLVGALIEQGVITPEKRIAIIGAGVAGLTAATVALSRGCRNIQVFEKRDKVAATFEGSSRLVDPRLYEWPVAGWNIEQAELPLLTWSGATGREITSAIRTQWAGWMRIFGPEAANRRAVLNLNTPVLPKGITDSTERLGDRDVLKIVAVGFGPPSDLENLRGEPAFVQNYWASPEEAPNEKMRIGVVGAQDAGLTEAIEHALWDANGQPISQHRLRDFLNEFASVLGESRMRAFAARLMKLDAHAVEGPKSKHLPAGEELGSHGIAAFEEALRRVGFRPRGEPPVLVFVRTNAKEDPPIIKPDAFLLNRWLAAHLVRLRAMQLVACEGRFAERIVREPGGCVVSTWGGNREVDRLFVRTGPQPVEGWKEFLETFSKVARRRAGATGSTWKRHIMYQIARRPPPAPAPGSRCFYSDLFDSPTQRAVLDVLIKEHSSLEEAERELVRLYRRRFLLEVARRDLVLLSDNQVFDGAFFLRWLPQLAEREIANLIPHVRIGARRLSPREVLDAFVSNGRKAKEFEFSAVVVQEHRDTITDVLRAERPLSGILGVRDLLVSHGAAPAVLEAWDTLAGHHGRLIRVLETPASAALIHLVDMKRIPMDHASALEDPGAFEQNHKRSNDLVDFAFKRDEQGRPRPRTSVYGHFAGSSLPSSVVEPTRDWYDRGYTRASAFQHAGAASASLVFETVRTEGLPEFHGRNGDASSIEPQKREQLESDASEFMFRLRGKYEALRHTGGTRWFRWSGQEPPSSPRLADLGGRALALLRGSEGLTRCWTEEASQVGPRVPAVIDEEHLGEGSSQIRLNRVEYFGDVNRQPRMMCRFLRMLCAVRAPLITLAAAQWRHFEFD